MTAKKKKKSEFISKSIRRIRKIVSLRFSNISIYSTLKETRKQGPQIS